MLAQGLQVAVLVRTQTVSWLQARVLRERLARAPTRFDTERMALPAVRQACKAGSPILH